VDVAIDGNPPSRMDAAVQILEFVFGGLAAGEHPAMISGVIGHSESALVMIVEALPDEQEAPDWLANGWQTWKSEPLNFRLGPSPDTNTKGETVYYVLKESCYQFSDLLDADGNLIGHPEGGITGRCDGFTVFSTENLEDEKVCLGR